MRLASPGKEPLAARELVGHPCTRSLWSSNGNESKELNMS